jgi:NAD(P)-dependent dehydrogenase (short-subunit alcohol dehydrogenase family)
MAERHATVPLELFWKEDPQNWSQQFEVNVTGVFFTTVAFLKLLKNANEHWRTTNPGKEALPQRLSQVISVTGISAHYRGMSGCAGYALSKAALLHLMRTLETLMAPLDIRFVSLHSQYKNNA